MSGETGVSVHGPGSRPGGVRRAIAAWLAAAALLCLPACASNGAVRTDGAGGEAAGESLPGGKDPALRVESGRAYEAHTWFNLAQHQYLEALRLEPGHTPAYEALVNYLGRIQAYAAAWRVAARARARGTVLDAALLQKLDQASGWPISTGDPSSPPPAVLIEAEERVRELAGVSFAPGLPRERVVESLRRAEAAQDRLIQIAPLVGPRLLQALRSPAADPFQRLALAQVLLRTELALRGVGEPPDTDLVRESAEAALSVDAKEWWHPLWGAATLFARLGDVPGHAVIARVMGIDGTRVGGIYAGRMDWDLMLVFAVGPLGEDAERVLGPILRGEDPIARANALRALAVLFDDRLRPAVRGVHDGEWAPEYRLMIALFHLQFLDPRALKDLVQVLEHPGASEAHRMAAVQALGEFGTSEAREVLDQVADAGNSVVNRHAQQVRTDLKAGRLSPPEPAGSALSPTQASQALRELAVEYGVGTARLQDSFLRSCRAAHLPLLYRLRGRILWRVTDEALADLKAVNEVIRRVLRRE